MGGLVGAGVAIGRRDRRSGPARRSSRAWTRARRPDRRRRRPRPSRRSSRRPACDPLRPPMAISPRRIRAPASGPALPSTTISPPVMPRRASAAAAPEPAPGAPPDQERAARDAEPRLVADVALHLDRRPSVSPAASRSARRKIAARTGCGRRACRSGRTGRRAARRRPSSQHRPAGELGRRRAPLQPGASDVGEVGPAASSGARSRATMPSLTRPPLRS